MRVTIIALGSRGDVQPFIALGLGLANAGYSVRIAAAEDYAPLVRSYGLDFAALVGRIRLLLDPQAVESVLDAAHNPIRVGYHFFRAATPLVYQLVRDCAAAAHDADVLIMSTLGQYCGMAIANKYDLPRFVVHMHPATTTRTLPHVFFPRLPRRLPGVGRYNRLTHQLFEHGFWQMLRVPLNRANQRVLGNVPGTPIRLWRDVGSNQTPTLLAYSPHLVPPAPDWQPDLAVTGYWRLPQPPHWSPSPQLVSFLAAGPAPVYISFGSMMLGADGTRVTRLLVAGLQQLGLRGILYCGWGDIGNVPLPPTILTVDTVPHDWLFPRVRLVVHHGGAGVTAACLLAGVPMVIVPFLGDQHFWANLMEAQGVAPRSIPRRQLTQARLVTAIRSVLQQPALQWRSAELGRQLHKEQGVERAVEFIERELCSTTAQRHGAQRRSMSSTAATETNDAQR